MNAVAAVTIPYRMIVASDLLGPIEATPEDIIHFADGLLGFPECRDFVLLPAARDGLFWLQSTDHSALAFLLADPFQFFDGYSVELGPAERAELQVGEATDVIILSIVTLPRPGETRATTNLQGPLAINLPRRLGRQVILSDSSFGIRCDIDLTHAME